MTWKERYQRMKEQLGYNDNDIASITGNTKRSIQTVVNSEKQEFPRWAKLAIVIFEEKLMK